jgi:hypothetical protein
LKGAAAMVEIKRISPQEFRDRGYLHEVNRLVLHPLGLALEVMLEECPFCGHESREDCGMCDEHGLIERFGTVWDCREDPEGIRYGEDLLSPGKAQAVYDEMMARRSERLARLGYMIQPIPGRKTLNLSHADRSEDRLDYGQ